MFLENPFPIKKPSLLPAKGSYLYQQRRLREAKVSLVRGGGCARLAECALRSDTRLVILHMCILEFPAVLRGSCTTP